MTLPIILLILVALVIGTTLGWLFATQRARAAANAELQILREQLARNDTALQLRGQHLEQLEEDLKSYQSDNEDLKIELARLTVKYDADAEKLTWLGDAKSQMRDTFEALAGQSLTANAGSFIDRAKEAVMDPLRQNLQTLDQHVRDLEQKREGAYATMTEQLRHLSEVNGMLQHQTQQLSSALHNSSARGRWGELQLRRIAEMSGMREHIDFEEQVATSDENRPDMMIFLPNGGCIPLDSKAPMAAYLEALETGDDVLRQRKLDDHVKAMRSRMKELSNKRYWDTQKPGPDFVIMFIPSEACMSAAFSLDPNLMEDALVSKVMVATPMTLLALLQAVAMGWKQIQLSENARNIADEARELHGRLTKFADHSNKLAKELTSVIEAHNSMIGSLQGRVLPSIRRLEGLSAGEQAVKFPPEIEIHVRTVRMAETPDVIDVGTMVGAAAEENVSQ